MINEAHLRFADELSGSSSGLLKIDGHSTDHGCKWATGRACLLSADRRGKHIQSLNCVAAACRSAAWCATFRQVACVPQTGLVVTLQLCQATVTLSNLLFKVEPQPQCQRQVLTTPYASCCAQYYEMASAHCCCLASQVTLLGYLSSRHLRAFPHTHQHWPLTTLG